MQPQALMLEHMAVLHAPARCRHHTSELAPVGADMLHALLLAPPYCHGGRNADKAV